MRGAVIKNCLINKDVFKKFDSVVNLLKWFIEKDMFTLIDLLTSQYKLVFHISVTTVRTFGGGPRSAWQL